MTSEGASRDRAAGALLGLAVGDAIGATLEFKPRDSYRPLTDMVGGGPFNLQPGQWTDDTAMALALAESLLVCGGLEEADLLERFDAWHKHGLYSCTGSCFSIGVTTRQALENWRTSGNIHAGSVDPRSAGNGSLMRLAPVAIRFARDRARLTDAAARQSKTTHGAVEAVDACVAYAQILADAIEGMQARDVLRSRNEPCADAIRSIVSGSWNGKARHQIRSSGYVAHSLEAALWSVGGTTRFLDAVLVAANLGEDADTTAAITGQLAGALYGASAIPAAILSRLAWREQIEGLALELFDAGCRAGADC